MIGKHYHRDNEYKPLTIDWIHTYHEMLEACNHQQSNMMGSDFDMQNEIFEVEGVGWYAPLKKLIVVPKKGNVSKERVADVIQDYESYYDEVKQLPQIQYELQELYIKSIGVLPTNQCSLHCVYCFSEAGDMIPQRMTEKQVETLIKEIVRNAVINKIMHHGEETVSELTLSGGGEPTFDWNLFVLFVERFRELCAKNGIVSKLKVVTNGCMSREHAQYMIKNIDEINLSFDGTERLQNFQRPLRNSGNSFPIVKNFIDLCKEADKKILVRSTVMPDHFQDIPNIVDELFQTFDNVDCVHLEPMINLGRAAEIESVSQNSLIDFMSCYIDAVELVSNKYKDRRIVNSLFSYGLTEYFCSAALGTHPWVHMDGKIMPCKDYIQDERYMVGELTDDGIVFNKKFEPMLYNQDQCKKCYAYYHCGGGCAVNMPKDEEGFCLPGTSSDFCAMVRGYWKRIFKLLVERKKFGELAIDHINCDGIARDVSIYKLRICQ